IGLGGLIVNLRPRRFRSDSVSVAGPLLAIVFALAVVAAAWVSFHTQIRLQTHLENWRGGVFVIVASLAPFTAGGLIVAHILSFTAESANRFYFFDLTGAGLACLLFTPLIGAIGAPSALLMTAAVGAAAGAVLAVGRLKFPCAILCGVLAAGAAANTR